MYEGSPEEEAKQQESEAKKKMMMEDERKKPTREEILEKKVSMARERGSRVLRVTTPPGNIIFNVLRQFDQAYINFKGRLGEPGGISYEEGSEIIKEVQEITIAFSGLTAKLSKKVRFRYFVPQEIQEMKHESK